MYKRLISKIDASVNFIKHHGNSVVEARYVRRDPNVISAYVSSHNGCKMKCKFCWLTATDQTDFAHSKPELYNEQLSTVLKYANECPTYDIPNNKIRVNINFMARGEPLANKYMLNNYGEISSNLNSIVKSHGYADTKINISTILPHTCYNSAFRENKLVTSFCNSNVNIKPNIYYSLYSLNDAFRKKWIPSALPWRTGLDLLKEYQIASGMPLVIHFAMIDGENDNLDEIKEMADIINTYDFEKLKFNIIQYNPPDNTEYRSASVDRIQKSFEILNAVAKDSTISTKKSRIVPRVGFDVMASCGMFVADY